MAKERINIPKKDSDEIIFKNRHICCICRTKRKHIEIHHIDSDPSNNEPINLAVLCKDCHSVVTGNEGLGRSYSVDEVKLYKLKWEELCKNWLDTYLGSDEEIFDDVEGNYNEDFLSENTHTEESYELSKGDVLLISIESDILIDLLIMEESSYLSWRSYGIKNFKIHCEKFYSTKIWFVAPKSKEYSIVFVNDSLTEEAQIKYDISVWEE